MTTPDQLLSYDEIALIAACLRAAEEGPFFPEWEFQTLFGIERAELAEVRRQWPNISLSDEKAYLAVTNCIPLLLGYPHREDKALRRLVPGGRKEIARLGDKLAALPAPGTALPDAIPNRETVCAIEELNAGRGEVSSPNARDPRRGGDEAHPTEGLSGTKAIGLVASQGKSSNRRAV